MSRPTPWPPRGVAAGGAEHGSATVYVALIGLLLVAAAGVAGALAEAMLARHRAETVADLAALAAVGSLGAPGWNGATGCAAAADLARRHGTTLLTCRPGPDGSVSVSVAADGHAGLLAHLAGLPPAVGRARAG